MSQPAQQQQQQQQQQAQGNNGDGGDGNGVNPGGAANGMSGEMKIIEEKAVDKKTGVTTLKKYSRGKLLGSGGFAKCYEVISQETKVVLAGKIIPKTTLTKQRQRVKLISEIKIHKSLNHKNIVQFEHVFEDAENVYILLELCPYQTLNELIKRRKRITEFETQVYVLQVVHALKYLHANKIIHRDLKLGNLFLGDNMTLKLGDFGLATKIEFEGEKKKTICGTPNYIAPEILEGKDGHSYEVDMWSLGVIIYTLLFGKPPYETKDVRTTYSRIKKNNYCFPESVTISDNAKSLITSILNLNPAKRPTLDELLMHPFMEGCTEIPESLPISSLAVPYSKLKDAAAQKEKEKEKKGLLHQNNFTQSSTNLGGNPQKEIRSSSNKGLNNENDSNNINNNGLRSQQNFRNNANDDFRNSNNQSSIPPASEIWVKQWVDYSSKYGLGYSLNNCTIGVHFNDGSKMVGDPSGSVIEYYERVSPEEKQDKFHTFTTENYPPELKSKIALLSHFRNFLEGDISKEGQVTAAPNGQLGGSSALVTAAAGGVGSAKQSQDNIYRIDPKTGKRALYFVKKWVKTKNSILFRLSNQIVQVNFSDKTEIILNSLGKTVTYRNLQGLRQNYPLNQTYNKYDNEMAKRLKYAKEILSDIIVKNNNPNNQQPQQQQQLQFSNNTNHNQHPQQMHLAQSQQQFKTSSQLHQQQQQQQLPLQQMHQKIPSAGNSNQMQQYPHSQSQQAFQNLQQFQPSQVQLSSQQQMQIQHQQQQQQQQHQQYKQSNGNNNNNMYSHTNSNPNLLPQKSSSTQKLYA